MRVSADTAVISLGVNARDRDVLKAQQQVNASIAAIRQALLDFGVKEENINTEFINIYAVYDYRDGSEQLTAYHAGTTLSIRTGDMESAGVLIDLCFAAGANTLNGITFSASDTKEAKNEALKKAVADAKGKAEILAGAAGLAVTGIEAINEEGSVSYANSVGNAYEEGFETADAGTVIQAARLVVSASVTITFTAE